MICGRIELSNICIIFFNLLSIGCSFDGAVGKHFRLMHYNVHPHVARIATNWLTNEGIEVLPLPV